jgi:hypothetical protein
MGAITARVLLVLALVVVAPEAASAKVLKRSPWAGKARAAAAERQFTTPSGVSLGIAVSPLLVEGAFISQSYADFLDSLEHGPELAQLKVYIAPADEIGELCGAEAMACYSPDGFRMFVPSEELEVSTGITTSYVIAHEYGHHVAAFRSHAPFDALAYGPKHWASYQRVCAGARNGYFAPGDQAERYQENPGEAWAETYAQLRYPGVRWFFADALAPNRGALAAARRDVLSPWTEGRSQTFSGRFRRAKTRRYTLPVTLDGALAIELDGPARAQLDLRLDAAGKTLARSRTRGSDDTLALPAVCRDAGERLQVTVVRRSGRGAFGLTVRYPG